MNGLHTSTPLPSPAFDCPLETLGNFLMKPENSFKVDSLLEKKCVAHMARMTAPPPCVPEIECVDECSKADSVEMQKIKAKQSTFRCQLIADAQLGAKCDFSVWKGADDARCHLWMEKG